ncbi:hypothetical protein L1987_17513 [Smallanthus sonchifolius]|uniref:Uncharacterized protein n=1 Tax=Smallanthus sonchifolius TaxID=185202 RepID=A0ACB9IZ66_9ASTR|nr:hypothetical protein L1987_17513 [Smallanthus sonchifolius]
MLNIPIIVPPSPSPASGSKPAFSFFESLKKYAAAQAHKQREAGETNPTVTNQSTSSLSLPKEEGSPVLA